MICSSSICRFHSRTTSSLHRKNRHQPPPQKTVRGRTDLARVISSTPTAAAAIVERRTEPTLVLRTNTFVHLRRRCAKQVIATVVVVVAAGRCRCCENQRRRHRRCHRCPQSSRAPSRHSSHAELPSGVHAFSEAAIDRLQPSDGSIQCAEIAICASEISDSLNRHTTVTTTAVTTRPQPDLQTIDDTRNHIFYGNHSSIPSKHRHTHTHV